MTTSGFIMTNSTLFMACLTLLALCVGLATQAEGYTNKTYEFTVFLDDDEIGNQSFKVSSDGKRTQVDIEASFDVIYLYIPFYKYRHTNSEIWEGNCLKEIRAQTDDNGESFFVQGNSQNGQFTWQTKNGESSVKGCVKTYAYWNPNSFQSKRLLNSQTGELQPVKVSKVGEATIPVRGTPTKAEHRRIVNDEFIIDLWYTKKGEWVSLQSTTKDGKKLRYLIK
ncbi:MAG: hypothetical protein JSU59_08395 [Nitrospirota bacterium]|nr:MAG: hypothetical protein JSU59_08395 [Nitrospirota bacterium]